MNPSYNNSFGSANSGGGDVILSSPTGNEKKGSKKFIIIILALLVIVGAGVGVGVMMMNKNGGGSGSNNKKVIEKYVNYIINGDENDGNIGDGYVTNRIYYIATQVYGASDEEFDAFYAKSSGLLDVALKDNNTNIANVLAGQKDILDTLYIGRKYSENLTIESYLRGENTSMWTELRKSVELLAKSTNNYVSIYANDYLRMLELIVQMSELYYSVGCLGEDAEELLSCNIPSNSVSKFHDIDLEMHEVYSEMNEMEATVVTSCIKGAYNLLEVNNE